MFLKLRLIILHLTNLMAFSPFLLNFSFDPPETIREKKGFLMFSGGSNRNIGKKRVRCKAVKLFFQVTCNCSKLTIETLEKGVKYVQS